MTPDRMKLVEQLFGEAIGLEAADRERLLRSRCGEDSHLRREVEFLLECAGVQSGVLDGEAPDLVSMPRSPDEPALLPAGSKIGPYTIKSALGVGGMGVVYVGEQARPKRTVALKVIRPGFATQSVLKRFEYEAELLGRLQHPGIAQIIEAGSAQTPFGIQPFFAMELVEGRPLGKDPAHAAMRVLDKVALMVKVCDAVEHAHQRGVIHRDLKPANILVDEAGQPKILDFGVARATGGREAEQRLTLLRTGERQLVGTLAYMSPEQIAGDAREVDTRSDVYSLGVVLFELLSGRQPHDLTDKTLPDAVRIIRDEEPRRLSSISRVFRGDLDTIAGKALAKNPAHRYQSAAMLGADLSRYLENAPILARPPSAAYQIRKFAVRHRALTAAGVAAALSLAAGLAVSLSLWRDAEFARELAVIEGNRAVTAMQAAQDAQRDAEAEAARQQVIVRFFHDSILSESYWTGPSTATVTSLEDAIAEMPRVFAKDPLNEARLLYSAAQIFNSTGNITRSNACLVRAVSLYEANPKPPANELYDTRNYLAGQYAKSLDASMAFPLLDRNLTLLEQLPDPEGSRRATRMQIGAAHWAMGRYDEAEAFFLQQIDAAIADEKLPTMAAFVTTNRLAPMYAEMGFMDRAHAAWDRLVAREERRAGPNRAVTQFLEYAALMDEQVEDWPRAIAQRRRTLECLDRYIKPGSNEQVVCRSALVRDLLRLGSPKAVAEALAITADQVAAVKRGSSPFPAAHVDLYADRLAALLSARDATGAEAILPEALAASDLASVKPYQILPTRLAAARLALLQGRTAEAISLAIAEHERRVRVKGRSAPETLEALMLVSECLTAAHRPEEARSSIQQQIDARTTEVGLRDFDTITLLRSGADAALARGDLPEAERLLTIAWRESEALTGWYSKRSLQFRASLAHLKAQTGQRDAARALLEDGLTRCRTMFPAPEAPGTPPHPRTSILLQAMQTITARS